MQVEALNALIEKIQHYKCEFQNIEVKAAEGGCPKLYDTLSSFSNQDDGGVIILGLREREKGSAISDFRTVGVYNVQDVQQKVAAQCLEMQPRVRPLFTITEIDEKFVVAVEVPSVDVSERPVYYKGAGRQQGSYVRVGDADQKMTDYEIYSYDAFRRRVRDDIRKVENAKINLLRADLLEEYLFNVKQISKNLSQHSSDEEILELMGVTSDGVPTLAGVMAFGLYPQAYFPQLDITAVVVPGLEMGDTGEDGARFIDNERINGTIPEMLQDAVDFVSRNMRKRTIINDEGKRQDKTEFPIKAVREVILNALLHRDYSIHTEGSPITICMFKDRMEVVNKGGLYGRISVDQLGKVRPDTRNPALANILEVMQVTENRFSGIPTIKAEMKKAGLPEPVFSTRNSEFKVILKNNYEVQYIQKLPTVYSVGETTANDYNAAQQRLLAFCKVPRSRAEMVAEMNMSRYYVMDSIVKPLLEQGVLKMTMPDKPKSSKQRFYSEE